MLNLLYPARIHTRKTTQLAWKLYRPFCLLQLQNLLDIRVIIYRFHVPRVWPRYYGILASDLLLFQEWFSQWNLFSAFPLVLHLLPTLHYQ